MGYTRPHIIAAAGLALGLSWCVMVEQTAAEMMHARFKDIAPQDFDDGVRFCGVAFYEPPPNLSTLWSSFTDAERLDVSQIVDEHGPVEPASCIVVVTDPFSGAHMELLKVLFPALHGRGHFAPLIIVVPHTTPESAEARALPRQRDVAFDLMHMGADAVLANEPAGLLLAACITAEIRRVSIRWAEAAERYDERRAKKAELAKLRAELPKIVWDYAVPRLLPSLPVVDHSLEVAGEIRVPGFALGEVLGHGKDSIVHKLIFNSEGAADQVLQLVKKASVEDLGDLKCIKRMTKNMEFLTSICPHPNITKLHEVYHGPLHLMHRMEYGGPENLFKRLLRRQAEHDAHSPLGLSQVRAIVLQVFASVEHLHTKACICHRDIKPESFLVDGTEQCVSVKISNFLLSISPEVDGKCHTPCGTLPFCAPEVWWKKEPYDGFAADMWSLGIVLMEVFCGIANTGQRLAWQTFKTRKGFRQDPSAAVAFAESLKDPGAAGQALERDIRSELRELCPDMQLTVDRMLRWDAPSRMLAGALQKLSEDLRAVA